MEVLTNVVRSLTRVTSWIGLITLFMMMVFIPIGVISRELGHPVLGDVELVQLGMVVLIMFGLGYTQSVNGHIAIGIVVDRFSQRAQAIIDIFAYTLTLIISWIISWVFVGNAMANMLGMKLTTDLLNIPFFPFKFCIVIGFFLWGLEALLKVITSIQNLITGNFTVEKGTNEGGDGL